MHLPRIFTFSPPQYTTDRAANQPPFARARKGAIKKRKKGALRHRRAPAVQHYRHLSFKQFDGLAKQNQITQPTKRIQCECRKGQAPAHRRSALKRDRNKIQDSRDNGHDDLARENSAPLRVQLRRLFDGQFRKAFTGMVKRCE